MKLVPFLLVSACLIVAISAKLGGEGLCGTEVYQPLQRCVCDKFGDYDSCHCEGPLARHKRDGCTINADCPPEYPECLYHTCAKAD